MNERIKKLAEIALTKTYPKDTEYHVDETEQPQNIGRAVGKYIEIQPIDINPNEYLIDRYGFSGLNVAGDYYSTLSEKRSKYWHTCCNIAPHEFFYWGWTHVSINFNYIINNGFKAYYKRIFDARAKFINDNEKQNFYDGMVYCLDGIINRYKKFANKIDKLILENNGEYDVDVLKRIADSLTRIPMEPAKTFFDAVQFTWIAFKLAPDSLGRIDQYLYPFYKNDIEKGTLTDELAKELLEELFIRVHETQIYNVVFDISGHNHLVVGGYKQDGEDGFNELSKIILEAIVELPTYRPQASFRYTSKTTKQTMRYITEMNIKKQLIVFVNDEPRIKGMVNCGIAYEDAVEYSVIGCNEWALEGKLRVDLTHISLVHSLEKVLYGDFKPNSFEDLYKQFELSIKTDCDAIIDEYSIYADVQRREKNVLSSILHEDCIENGLPLTDRGTRYYGVSLSYNGISNVADSLSILKQFVFESKTFTYEQVIEALKNNWVGYEDMRNLFLNKGHYFGNDDDYVDNIAKDIVDSLYRVKNTVNHPYIKNVFIGSFVGATHPNIIFGKKTKATPDGRYNGDEFTMGLGQTEGKDHSGISSLLKSIAKIDYTKLCGCVVSNLKMDKDMCDTPEKIDKLASIYHTFLKLGGMQLQINYISTEELIEAQNNPDKYKNLMVRVTGYSGYFTRFGTDLQNDIINRTSQR